MNTFDPHGDDDLKLPAGQGDGGAVVGDGGDAGLASNVIRDKLKRIYAEEPEATRELAEAAKRSTGRSKHQEFMYKLGTSGKDLASIQTEWHKYYEDLSDDEKHAVWHEFYASQSALTKQGHGKPPDSQQALARNKNRVAKKSTGQAGGTRNAQEIKRSIRDTVNAGGKLQAKHHIQSLLFGLGLGLVVIIIFMFGFFNEVFIAPFIQPSRASAATPIIISASGPAPTNTSEVIIPKINVQIPADYSETSTNEAAIENDLQSGVVHYPTTALPGQDGNAAFFGHSSNNIFNQGKYKFAFVLLHTLQPGDTFYLTYKDKVYVYKVISRKIVNPDDVAVLGPVSGQKATATLITCDPPGTSLHRLVVVGQQISPDPAGNSKSPVPASTNVPVALPGNGPTLWGRFISTTLGKLITIAVIAGAG
ncbi:MAG: sortase, partial [Candidatus Saccharimonadales bacterium]